MTLGTKLKLLMIFLVVTLVCTSIISFWSSNRFSGQISNLVEVQIPGMSNMILADMMHDGIRANVYRSILIAKTKSPEEQKEVQDESDEFAKNMKEYIGGLEKLSLPPQTKAAIAPTLPRIEEYVQAAHEIVKIALSGDEEKARASLPKFNEKFEVLEKELGALDDLIKADASSSEAKSKEIKQQSLYANLASLAIGVLLVIVFSMVVSAQQNQLRDIISNLVNESKRISTTATNINTSAQNLAEATSEQSSAFQESAAALEEISATVNTTETNSRKLDINAKESYESATTGKEKIEEMLQAMDTINSSNSAMMKQIEEGNKKISEIVTVISEIENKTRVINDIVFQTKLLSFNASVEAARAGEQGKGFAVVAEEVGNLAQMSGNAAKEISDMLTSSISTVQTIVTENKTRVEGLAYDGKTKVEQGINIAHKCGNALEEIVGQASSINGLISEITTAVQEQSKGINEVSKAMGLLDQTSGRNSTTSQETLVSAQELRDQVTRLERIIDSLSSMMTSSKTPN